MTQCEHCGRYWVSYCYDCFDRAKGMHAAAGLAAYAIAGLAALLRMADRLRNDCRGCGYCLECRT